MRGFAMIRVDAHQHFWDPSRADYGWLQPSESLLYRPFDRRCCVRCSTEPESTAQLSCRQRRTEAETDYLLNIAHSTDWTLGVVGWVDLDSPAAASRVAARAQQRKFVGHPAHAARRALIRVGYWRIQNCAARRVVASRPRI